MNYNNNKNKTAEKIPVLQTVHYCEKWFYTHCENFSCNLFLCV